MALFKPCQGKSACRDDGVHCLTCGRTLEEIVRLRDLMDQLASLGIQYQYENIDEYTGYIGRKLEKIISHRRREQPNHAQAD